MNSRSSRFTLLAVVAALFVNNLVAQEAADDAKPSFSASQSVRMTATVDAINMETREVTLRDEAGDTQTITIGEEARNLGQVKTGDIVTVEFVRELDVQVFADDGSELTTEAVAAAGRAEEGEMPGGVAIQSEVVTARVAEINLENNTFKLQWPDDSVEEFVAQNPDNLRRAAVGDIVVITYTEAVGILVERPTAE